MLIQKLLMALSNVALEKPYARHGRRASLKGHGRPF